MQTKPTSPQIEALLFSAIVLTGVVIITHVTFIDFEFLYQDQEITHYNGFTTAWSNLEIIWKGQAIKQQVPEASRWVTVASYMLDRTLFGLNAGGHHAQSLWWHICNTLLLAWLIFKTRGDIISAWLAGLIFAIHPAQLNAVAVVSNREFVLAVFFWILTLVFLQHRKPMQAAITLILGIWAAEIVITVLLAWPIWKWMHHYPMDHDPPPSQKHEWYWLLPAMCLALGARMFWNANANPFWPGLSGQEVVLSWPWQAGLQAGYIGFLHLVMPIGFQPLLLNQPDVWPWLFAGWLFFILGVAGFFLVRIISVPNRIWLGSAGIMLASLFPMFCPLWPKTTWSNATLYLGTVGVSVLFAYGIRMWIWPKRWHWIGVAAIWIFLWVTNTLIRQPYRNDQAFWTTTTLHQPKLVKSWEGLAATQLKEGKREAALQSIQKGFELNPNDVPLLGLYGVMTCLDEQQQTAWAAFEQASAEETGRSSRLLLQMAGCALRLGDPARAEIYANEALIRNAWLPDALAVLGLAKQSQGRLPEAQNDLLMAIDMAPDRSDLWAILAFHYDAWGDFERAKEARQKSGLSHELIPDVSRWIGKQRN